MSKIYGYARVSTMHQNLDRQLSNIKAKYPDAVIITEKYTGTTTDRPNLNKLIKTIKEGDTLVFDEVSRMSRNVEEGIELYEQLFNAGINLVFIKEPHINSSVYRDKLNKQVEKLNSTGSKATDKLLDSIMTALHEYTIDLAREQIEIAFMTAEAEVVSKRKAIKEGMKVYKENYEKDEIEGNPHKKNRVGRQKGIEVITKKSINTKDIIRKHSKDFDGQLTDIECMKLADVSRNSYYKYKKELAAEIEADQAAV